jgi:polysaccharide export outer membrane protein
VTTRLSIALALLASATLAAQTPSQPASRQPPPQPPPQSRPAAPAPDAGTQKPAAPEGLKPPSDYVIGADDVLGVVVWREQDLSTDVRVRPDGRVSLPLVNDVVAGGLTPEEFRVALTTAFTKFVEAPNVTVIVRQINSRQVFVLGEVVKPGTYPLTAPTTGEIAVVRTIDGRTTRHVFNYNEVTRGRKVEQNIPLRPGDTVIVP